MQLGFAMWLGWLPLGGRFPIIEEPPPFVTGLLTVDALVSGNLHALGLALLYFGPHRGGALDRQRQLVDALREARPEELHDRRLRARLEPALEPRQRSAVEQPHDLDVDVGARDRLAYDGIARARELAGAGAHVVERDPLEHLLLERETGAPLVREGRHRDLPAVVDPADDVRAGHRNGVEEDLAELGRAGQLAEGADRDPRALHVEDEVGEAAVLRQ